MIVARGTNMKAAKLLLDHGANVNAVEQQKKQTALMWASAQSQPEMVRELISHGADVNARAFVNPTANAMFTDATPMDWPSEVSAEPRAQYRPPGGLTPLLYATREGCLDCVKALVEGKANIDLQDPEGVTPLIMAITNMHFDVAAYLIKAGANVDKWDLWGRNPLYCAADVNTLPHGGRADRPSLDETTSLQVIEMLLNAGANPNLQLKLLPPYRNIGADRGVDGMLTIGATPLLRAAKALDAPAIALLLKHGANPNLPNMRGTTPTMAAAGLGSVDADTRGVYTTEDTAQRSVESLKLILDAGGEINAKDNIRGQTPLHGAAFWGWNAAVQLLVDRGADLNAKDNQGKTPIDSALGKAGGNSRGGQRIDVHEDTAELLRKLMAAR
jgi:ankyrin repeat protein